MKNKKTRIIISAVATALIIAAVICVFIFRQNTSNIYAKNESWAYCETTKEGTDADVFFVCPTVYGGDTDSYNMSMDDSETKSNFVGAINMEKGIYDDNARFFAPYYRQVGLNVYEMPVADRQEYLSLAYEDIKAAFEYYMDHYNEGRPVVIAGFSQGAELSLRLMKDYFSKEEKAKQLVACYAIGWSITQEEMKEYPHLKFAATDTDTGVIVSFNSEAENIDDSLMIPKGTRTLAINPLNWKNDGSKADKSLNLGACFVDYNGQITNEIPSLTGAYIDNERGALKVPDVTLQDYPAMLYIFEDGIYHIYDYQFFYRNLEKNVQDRIKAYVGQK